MPLVNSTKILAKLVHPLENKLLAMYAMLTQVFIKRCGVFVE
jgi:hypothetical protein